MRVQGVGVGARGLGPRGGGPGGGAVATRNTGPYIYIHKMEGCHFESSVTSKGPVAPLHVAPPEPLHFHTHTKVGFGG